MSDKLKSLIGVIESRLAVISDAYDGDWAKWEARQREFQAIINDLVIEEKAKYRSGDPYVLTLSGIRASCTSGDRGLLTNWIGAARRAIEQAKAGAA
jgi:hypothetical protein